MKVSNIIIIYSLIIFMNLGIVSCVGSEELIVKVNPEQLFASGNDYYAKGEYVDAINEYNKVLSSGIESGGICFNLANAYFKSGELGRAILNYERALCQEPRNADIVANYKFAQTMVKGNIAQLKGIWAWAPLKLYSRNFTIDELTWASSSMFILALIFLLIGILRRTTRRFYGILIALIAMLTIGNSAIVWHKIKDFRTSAIVVSTRTEAMFGPFESATKFFTLHEGMEVSVLKTKEGWVKVKRADGKVGWIKSESVERL